MFSQRKHAVVPNQTYFPLIMYNYGCTSHILLFERDPSKCHSWHISKHVLLCFLSMRSKAAWHVTSGLCEVKMDSVRYDRHRWLTLAAVLICLSVDHLFDVASVQQTWGVVVEGLERLAGAVGLLGGHAAVLAVAGWARVAALFLSPALG